MSSVVQVLSECQGTVGPLHTCVKILARPFSSVSQLACATDKRTLAANLCVPLIEEVSGERILGTNPIVAIVQRSPQVQSCGLKGAAKPVH